MATLKEFEEVLREQGMKLALGILEKLRERDRANRSITPARRVVGRKMTPDLARAIQELHETTKMTQQEIAFKLGVNQGRVNEVIKRGKWLTENPAAPEALARDRALSRIGDGGPRKPRRTPAEAKRRPASAQAGGEAAKGQPTVQPAKGGRTGPTKGKVDQGQLLFGDLP